MSDFIGFLEVIGAILSGLALAMSLEWLTLNGLLRLMPAGGHAKFRRGIHAESIATRSNHFSPR